MDSSVIFSGAIASSVLGMYVYGRTATSKLHRLFQNDFDWSLRDNPEFATQAGFHEYNSRLQRVRPEDFDRRADHSRDVLKELKRINRSSLSREDQFNYDLFRACHQDLMEAMSTRLYLCSLNSMCHDGPLNNIFEAVQVMRFQEEVDYARYHARLSEFPRQIDDYIELLREGVRSGMVISKTMYEGVPGQLDELTSRTNTYPRLLAPIELPHTPLGWKKRIKQLIEFTVNPAFEKFRDFLKEEYEPHLRDDPACYSLPDGENCYRICLKYHTSTDFTPDQIHELGLSEVARIGARMDKIIAAEGFSGTRVQFGEHIANMPEFKWKDREDLSSTYSGLCDHIEGILPQFFSVFPKNDLEIQFAEGGPAAFYMVGTPDGSRKGQFRVNVNSEQGKYEAKALTAHEAIPGHHMHCSMMVENTTFPDFRRYIEDRRYDIMPCRGPMYTASFEGWALYCEALGEEMGLYENNYELWGRLGMEMMRAVRLVVDTGIHSRGWSVERAVAYFHENTGMHIKECESECKRYATWPGQATAYKVGENVIKNLRAKCEESPNFDLIKFHDSILKAGPLPMSGPISLETVVLKDLNL